MRGDGGSGGDDGAGAGDDDDGDVRNGDKGGWYWHEYIIVRALSFRLQQLPVRSVLKFAPQKFRLKIICVRVRAAWATVCFILVAPVYSAHTYTTYTNYTCIFPSLSLSRSHTDTDGYLSHLAGVGETLCLFWLRFHPLRYHFFVCS